MLWTLTSVPRPVLTTVMAPELSVSTLGVATSADVDLASMEMALTVKVRKASLKFTVGSHKDEYYTEMRYSLL